MDVPNNSNLTKPLSLYDLLYKVKTTVKNNLSDTYLVHAEIYKYIKTATYVRLELSTESNQNLKAKTSGIILRKKYSIIDKFKSVTGTNLDAGVKILFQCTVQFHTEYGLSVTIHDINPSYTLGDMEQNLRDIRAWLKEKGEYNKNKQLKEPSNYFRVAVISPQNAASLSDFNKGAKTLLSSKICTFEYHTASFQGINAISSLKKAMLNVVESNKNKTFDVLVIIRGGGDKAGLYQLNHALLARWICRFPIPVFVGIGHENDRTILDEVANKAFSTPSYVINFIFNKIHENTLKAKELYKQIYTCVNYKVIGATHQIEKLITNIENDSVARIQRNKSKAVLSYQRLVNKSQVLNQHANQSIGSTFQSLNNISSEINMQSKEIIKSNKKALFNSIDNILLRSKNINETAYTKILNKTDRWINIQKAQILKTIENIFSYARNIKNRHVKNTREYNYIIEQKSNQLINKAITTNMDLERKISLYSVNAINNASKKIISHFSTTIDESNKIINYSNINLNKKFNIFQSKTTVLSLDIRRQLYVLTSKINNNSLNLISNSKNKLIRFKEHILLQDPQQVLSRGFVLVKSTQGRPLTKIKLLNIDQQINLIFNDGIAIAKIEEINND